VPEPKRDRMKQAGGIMVHRTRPEALHFAREVVGWLEARDITVRMDPAAAEKLKMPVLACRSGDWEHVSFIITLGGDGTILTAARQAAPCGVPILGVHMGRFGFIAETHPEDLYGNLEEILGGQVRIEERLMVRADILRDDQCVHSGFGLNDVILKSKMPHLLHLKTRMGGAHFAAYPADGVVVATPTGSTGYALSAGGPLISPCVEAFAFVPICPHTLSARPIIVPSNETIEVEVETDGHEVIFAIDGVEPVALETGDRIVIQQALHRTRLIIVDHTTFYAKIRNRYLYGERLNN
jgi:NAD+ kinase